MQQEYSHRIWFLENDPHLLEFDRFKDRFGNDENIILVYYNEHGIFNGNIRKVHELTEILWRIPNVVRVDSLSNFNMVEASGDDISIFPFYENEIETTEMAGRFDRIYDNPEIKNYLISDDKKTAVLYARMRPIENGIIHYNNSLNALKEKLKDWDGAGGEVHLAGTVPLNVSFRNLSMKDLQLILPMVLVLICLTLLYIFRSFKVLLFSMLTLSVSIIVTMGMAGILGIKLSMIVSMVPCIIAAIALADTIHIISTYLSRKGSDGHGEALKQSLHKNVVPTLLTSLTTSIGFMGLVSSDLNPIRSMGALAAMGVLFSWIATFFFLVPLISFFELKGDVRRFEKKWNAVPFVNFLGKYRLGIITVSFLIAVGSGILISGNKINSNIIKYFSDDLPVRRANEFLQHHVGGYSGVQIVVDTGSADGIKKPALLRKVDGLVDELKSRKDISKVVSLLDILKKTNMALHGDDTRFYQIPRGQDEVAQQLFLYGLSVPEGKNMSYWYPQDYSAMRIDVLWTIDDSTRAVAMIEEIRKLIKKHDVPAKVTGKAALISGLDEYILKTFLNSTVLAVALVSLLMMIIFRSVTIGLFSMIPNVLPPMVGLAILTLMGGNFDVGVVLIVAVCMGIAVDDTIYFLVNYRKAMESSDDVHHNLIDVLSSSGRSLVYTSAVLVLGFLSFAVGDFIPNRNFGIITSVVLLFALIADLILLPALISLKDSK